jgi:hypothetical protein
VGEPERKATLGRVRYWLLDNIEMELEERLD